ncbi:MAG TPA: glycosyltransferase family 87 protein [Candidatus Omnitrophota bacterium]|nr:glycosyltransferase family 87 protein [Candidatus Omnitrophota bacterium]
MRTIQKIIESVLRKKWLGCLVLTAFFIGVGISTVYRGALGPKQRTDLVVYLKAAEMINSDRANHLYGIETSRHFHYVYSPFLAILLTPLERLPVAVSVFFFYIISVAALLGALFLSRSFREKSQNIDWQIVISAIFCLPVFLQTFSRGQLGIIMLFLAILIFYSYLNRWRFVAGFLLGFAISLKISPLSYLIFFFLFKKEWRVLASTLVGIILFLFIFPSLVIGIQQNWALLKIWKSLMSAGSLDQAYKNYLWSELFTPFAEKNQSLYAVITRLAWPSEEKFIGASNNLIRSITSAFGFILLILLFLKRLPSKSAQNRDCVPLLCEYSLYPMLMLFASPVSQAHHYTALFLLFLGAFSLLQRYPYHSRDSIVMLTCIWIAAGFMFLGFVIPPVFSYLGSPLWGSLILWGGVLFYLNQISVKK